MSVIWTIWWMVICHEMAKWSLFFITPLHSTLPLPTVFFSLFHFRFRLCYSAPSSSSSYSSYSSSSVVVAASFYQLYIAHLAVFVVSSAAFNDGHNNLIRLPLSGNSLKYLLYHFRWERGNFGKRLFWRMQRKMFYLVGRKLYIYICLLLNN